MFLGRVKCRNIEPIKKGSDSGWMDWSTETIGHSCLFRFLGSKRKEVKISYKITTGKLVMHFSLLRSGAYYKAMIAFL